MAFLLEFPVYDDDTNVYIEDSPEGFKLVCDGKDLSHMLPNLRTKDEISYVLDRSSEYNSTLLEAAKVLDHDKKEDGSLPPEEERKENLAIVNVLKQLDKEAIEANSV